MDRRRGDRHAAGHEHAGAVGSARAGARAFHLACCEGRQDCPEPLSIVDAERSPMLIPSFVILTDSQIQFVDVMIPKVPHAVNTTDVSGNRYAPDG